jgi:hypothetical protein
MEVLWQHGRNSLSLDKRFSFRGKNYKFLRYFPVPSITMIADDGTTFSFGEDPPVSKEFILIDSRHYILS